MDYDRLKHEMVSDISRRIKRDAKSNLKSITNSLNRFNGSLGIKESQSKVLEGPDRIVAEVKTKVPVDKLAEFITGADSIVRSGFRFKTWKDMKI